MLAGPCCCPGADREGDVIEAQGQGRRRAMALALHRFGPGIFEKRHLGIAAAKEIMAIAGMTDAGDELHAEKVAVEADRLHHVAGNEGEVVDAFE